MKRERSGEGEERIIVFPELVFTRLKHRTVGAIIGLMDKDYSLFKTNSVSN